MSAWNAYTLRHYTFGLRPLFLGSIISITSSINKSFFSITLNVFAAGTDDDFIFGSVSKVVNLAPRTSGGATDTFYVANSPLTAKMTDGNPTAGDSTVRLFGTYKIVTIA